MIEVNLNLMFIKGVIMGGFVCGIIGMVFVGFYFIYWIFVVMFIGMMVLVGVFY